MDSATIIIYPWDECGINPLCTGTCSGAGRGMFFLCFDILFPPVISAPNNVHVHAGPLLSCHAMHHATLAHATGQNLATPLLKRLGGVSVWGVRLSNPLTLISVCAMLRTCGLLRLLGCGWGAPSLSLCEFQNKPEH